MASSVYRVLMRARLAQLDARSALYQERPDAGTVAATQVLRFNAAWARAWRTVPFYEEWRREHALPDEIASLADLDRFPTLTKTILRDRSDLVRRTPGATRVTLTGGTSGLSTAFPMGPEDADAAWLNTHTGRRWNGLEPGDRLFMIWGHSHLFSGRGAWKKQLLRSAKDRVNGIRRVSAYNLDRDRLAEICAELEAFRPTYVIAYGSCLMRVCEYLEAAGRRLDGAGVRRIVNTSESLAPRDAERVAAVFGCPVINEYGMAEAGVIGYSDGALYPIRVLWDDYIVRLQAGRLILTTVGLRCFPLINYDTEDLCPDTHAPDRSLVLLTELQGKARDIFRIVDRQGGEREVSVILFDHILKQIRELQSLHYELRPGGEVTIRYTASPGAPAPEMIFEHLAAGLKREGIDADPGRFAFEQIDKPLQTVAGKRAALSVN